MNITVSPFKDQGTIPAAFTCDGANINPAILIREIPEQTKSFAVTMVDIDSTYGLFVHWIMFNIPVTARIEKNSSQGEVGLNDFKTLGYGGPCPHSGTHRYEFRLYALECFLELKRGCSLAELENAMIGHILESSLCTGTYGRPPERS